MRTGILGGAEGIAAEISSLTPVVISDLSIPGVFPVAGKVDFGAEIELVLETASIVCSPCGELFELCVGSDRRRSG